MDNSSPESCTLKAAECDNVRQLLEHHILLSNLMLQWVRNLEAKKDTPKPSQIDMVLKRIEMLNLFEPDLHRA